MAPVEPDLFNSNIWPLLVYYTLTFTVAGLLGKVLTTISNAHRTLPPSQHTRGSHTRHRRGIVTFGLFAALSFGVATYFAVMTRVADYQHWAHENNSWFPNSLWSTGLRRGWYANEDNVARLGEWWKDSNLARESEEAVIETSKAFWWTQQQLLGTLVWSIFVGIEGKRPHPS